MVWVIDADPTPGGIGLRCDRRVLQGAGMAWDFETEPEFEAQLALDAALHRRAS